MLVYAAAFVVVRVQQFWLATIMQPCESRGSPVRTCRERNSILSAYIFWSGQSQLNNLIFHTSITYTSRPDIFDMAEYFGAAAASIALLTQLTQCGVQIHKAIKKIKRSRTDIAELADETIIFAGLCDDFLRTRNGERKVSTRGNSSMESLDAWIKKTLKGLQEVLQTVEGLRKRRSRTSLEKRLIAYLEWFFSASLVKRLRENMSVATDSVQGFSTLICIQKLNEELQMLRVALTRPSRRKEIEEELGMSIEDKINILQQAV